MMTEQHRAKTRLLEVTKEFRWFFDIADSAEAVRQAESTLEEFDAETHYVGQNSDGRNRSALLRQQARDRIKSEYHAQGTARQLRAGEWFSLSGHPVFDRTAKEAREFIAYRVNFTAHNNLPAELRKFLPQAPSSPFDGETPSLPGDASRFTAGTLGARGGRVNSPPLEGVEAGFRKASLCAAGTGERSEHSTGLADGVERPALDANSAHNANSPPPYTAHIQLQHRSTPLTPAYAHTRHAKPTANGMQTAVVVGPKAPDGREREEIYTDAMGRIRVQFHWQRRKEHPEYGANHDENSSCWMRVASQSAGAAWGTQFIPRVGQEVAVAFIEDDIDRPIVTGVIHNGAQHNPKFSGVGALPANRTLSGIKTKEHHGDQYNELLFDDTPGEVRTKLSSEHGKTQLNQGFLTHPRQDGAATPRGEGIEARSDRALALRGAEGVLISTEAKPGATGKQLDRELAQSQLDTARQIVSVLSDVAQHQDCDPTETGPKARDEEGKEQGNLPKGHIDHLAEAVHAWEAGTNTDPDGKTATGDQPGKQGILLLSGADGVGVSSTQEMELIAAGNLDTVSQRDTQLTVVRRMIANAGKKISFFVQGLADRVNLSLILAKGHALLHAQSGDVEMVGDKNVTLIVNKKKMTFAAKREILMKCGGAYILIKDGQIFFCASGTVSVKGDHNFGGPTRMDMDNPSFPDSTLEELKKGRMMNFSE